MNPVFFLAMSCKFSIQTNAKKHPCTFYQSPPDSGPDQYYPSDFRGYTTKDHHYLNCFAALKLLPVLLLLLLDCQSKMKHLKKWVPEPLIFSLLLLGIQGQREMEGAQLFMLSFMFSVMPVHFDVRTVRVSRSNKCMRLLSLKDVPFPLSV